jgi:hypothetical protein
MPVLRPINRDFGPYREFHHDDIPPGVYQSLLRVPPGGGFTSLPEDSHVLRQVIPTGEIIQIDLSASRPESKLRRGSVAARQAWRRMDGKDDEPHFAAKTRAQAGH